MGIRVKNAPCVYAGLGGVIPTNLTIILQNTYYRETAKDIAARL